MRIKIRDIVFFLMVYLPFETVILKYLPVNDTLYSLLRFIPEFLIYLLFIYVLGSKIVKNISLNKNPINTTIIIFITYSIFLILINSAPILESIIGLRAIFRYVFLFYVIINLDFSYPFIKKLVTALIIIAALQSLIAIYHHFFGINDFWMPRANTLEIGGKVSNLKILNKGAFRSGREIGVGIGTLGDSVALAMFLFIGCALIIPFVFKQNRTKVRLGKYAYIGLILVLSGLLVTYSRGSILISFMMLPLAWILVNRIKKIAFYSILILIIGIPLVFSFNDIGQAENDQFTNPVFEYTNPIKNVTSVFQSGYQQKTLENSRGYIMVVIGGSILKSLPLLGYGPAVEFALNKAIEENLSYINFNNLQVINDVYWVAFLIYFGIIGIVLFFIVLYKLFNIALYVYINSELIYYRCLGLSCALIIVSSIPYSFIIRTFVFRQFSLYFWTLAAFTVIEWIRLQKINSDEKSKLLKINQQ